MPFGKITKKQFKKYDPERRRAKKAKYQKPSSGAAVVASSNVSLRTPLLPVKMKGTLPYYEAPAAGVLFGGALTAGAYVFTANGLFDPNITAAGHQPMGFDQMMLWYEHYTVTYAKITVNFRNTDATIPTMVGICISPSATVETNFSKLVENGLLVRKLINNTSGDKSIVTLSLSANISKINGKRDVLNENDFRGEDTANPVEQTYFHVFTYNPWTVGVIGVSFDAHIDYTTTFTEPRKMVQS